MRKKLYIEVWGWDYQTKELLKDKLKAFPDERNPSEFILPPSSTEDKPPKGKRGYKIVWDLEQKKWKHVKKKPQGTEI